MNRHRLRTLAGHFALFVALLAMGGLLVSASGLMSIKASSGHWAITRWFLEFSSHRSVATHSLGADSPPRDSLELPRFVMKGAAHYETGCQPCHGSPAVRRPWIAQEMAPRPPYLADRIPEWEPEELFYVVKHGIKLTGMPAWPAQERDDEVWSVVAFLLTLPELDAVEYDRLVNGETAGDADVDALPNLVAPGAVPDAVRESCARCHGVSGLGRGAGAFPKLAGQQEEYLYLSLQAFARSERHSGVMEPIATSLAADEMRALARYFASREGLDASSPQAPTPPIERGEAIAQRGIVEQRVPACDECHGPGSPPRNPAYPVLAGQYEAYLVLQFELFQQNRRGGTPFMRLMHPTAMRLTAQQVRDVSRYYASLTTTVRGPVR